MDAETGLEAKLAKLEELFRRAGSSGERVAAGEAIDRLQARLTDARGEREVEMKFSLPDGWSVRLFVAVCRKHGLRPYRYARQRRTTVMIRAVEAVFDREVWPEFSRLQTELELYFEETVDHLITSAMRSDGDDSDLRAARLGR